MSVYDRNTDFTKPHLASMINQFASAAERVCVGCGCTNESACEDPTTGEACHWVEGLDVELCSVCAKVAAAVHAEDEFEYSETELAMRDSHNRISIYSPSEAQHFIDTTRAARLAVGL